MGGDGLISTPANNRLVIEYGEALHREFDRIGSRSPSLSNTVALHLSGAGAGPFQGDAAASAMPIVQKREGLDPRLTGYRW